MSEICDGPIIWIEKTRVWYAPWKEKVFGIRVNGVVIPLKQPEPDTFKNAVQKAALSRFKGKTGSLGGSRMWDLLREDWWAINSTLKSYGGDPLPEELMTAESFLFNAKRGRPECLDKADCLEDDRRYPYRIIF